MHSSEYPQQACFELVLNTHVPLLTTEDILNLVTTLDGRAKWIPKHISSQYSSYHSSKGLVRVYRPKGIFPITTEYLTEVSVSNFKSRSVQTLTALRGFFGYKWLAPTVRKWTVLQNKNCSFTISLKITVSKKFAFMLKKRYKHQFVLLHKYLKTI